ncbi:T9SS type A sorting domain-containing protein [Fulvivirga sp. 29W222]|uniref:T9SS type A sorting domain-containing protein n=1 Tax=Fulvivirga marina TaxID=2494733 RepID=A0A937FVC6_9BACT|nr:T9SS type A sorting domain-containing protein [Fulvivirga marina]MBL6444936.1 T9SS type A sorting domain-containing protein [Fulvivirga marina]
MKTLYAFTLIFCTSFSISKAQFVYTLDQSIPVEKKGVTLSMPWTGGLNSIQYSTIDLNHDGIEDLVAFDRSAHKVYPFLAVDKAYAYAPEYAFYFPAEIKNWMLLRDYNCDGKKDIFTSHSFGVRVFINETTVKGPLSWREYITGTDNSGDDQYFLKTKGFTSNINMQMNSSDIPAIVDIDGDSDLDILMFRASGTSTVEFHKNLSIERDGNCDSLQYERITQTWGNFQECQCGEFAFNGNDCATSGGREEHQGGKSILLLDNDSDGDYDVLISEETCGNLFIMENTGTNESPSFNSASAGFPNSSDPATMLFFPVGYYEDADFDGVRDMLVSPNVANNVSNSVNFESSSWFYKNIGTDNNPQFELKNRNFLQDQTIDLGENASPAFGDYDGDGDLDMILGSYTNQGAPGFNATLLLYENTGSVNEPSYVLKSEDYLQLSLSTVFNLKPKFRDVNGDNRVDLVFSATELYNFSTNVYYILNRGEGKFNFEEEIRVLFSNIGFDENFETYDISGDGLTDILIGKSTGKLEYYVNVGTINAPVFNLEDDTFYGLNFSTSRLDLSVTIADINSDGNADMIVGDKRGSLTIYDNFLAHVEQPENGITDFVWSSNEEVSTFNFGGKLYPAVANLFNEDKPSLIIGTGQGGLHLLRNSDALAGYVNRFDLDIFPNPVFSSSMKYINVSSKTSGNATIISLLGQQVTDSFYLPANTVKPISVAGLNPGMYIVILSAGNEYIHQRFIVVE